MLSHRTKYECIDCEYKSQSLLDMSSHCILYNHMYKIILGKKK